MESPLNSTRSSGDRTREPKHAAPVRVPDHELIRVISRGGFGEVWLAQNIMGNFRAVKIVQRADFNNAHQYEKEFEGLRRFDPISRMHEGLVDVLQMGRSEADGYYFYVMELADDEVFGQEIKPDSYRPRTLKSEIGVHGRLPLLQCVRTGILLADAVAHLHAQQLVHRDIKPANIIFVNGLPKLADIGLLAEMGAAHTWVGTEGYVPPEGPGRPPADIYALGKVLYEMVTGKDRKSFPESITVMGDAFDWKMYQELNAITIRACQARVEDRYQSALEMREHLAAVERGQSVIRLERRAKLATQGMKAAALVALLAMITAAFVAVRGRYLRTQEEARQQGMRQELMLQQLLMTRLDVHYAGWSEKSWDIAVKAAEIRATPEVFKQAVATLAGLDLRIAQRFAGLAATSLAYDRTNDRWVIGTVSQGVVVRNRFGNSVSQFSSGSGIVACADNGRAIHASLSPTGDGIWIRSEVDADLPAPKLVFSDAIRSHGPVVREQTELKFTPDGRFLAVAARLADGQSVLGVWETAAAREIFESRVDAAALAIAPDGSLLAVADETEIEPHVRLWSLPSGRELPRFTSGESRVHSLHFQLDPRLASEGVARDDRWLLAIGDAGGTITLWELRQRTARAHLRGSHFNVDALAFSPDGTLLASGGRGAARIWDAASGQPLLNIDVSDHVKDLAFSADGLALAIASLGTNQKEPKVDIWNLEDGRGIHTLRGLASQIAKVHFSPDGKLVAGLGHNWEIGVWELPSGRLRLKKKARKSMWTADNAALAIDPRGTKLAFAAGTEAKLWEIQSGNEVRSWDLPNGLIDAMGFHPSGQLLLFRREDDLRRPDATALSSGRVCRIRDLLGPDYLVPLAEDREFNAALFTVAAPLDASFFVVEGKRLVGTNMTRSVRVLDGITGAERWRTNVVPKSDFATLYADPHGKWIGYNPDGNLDIMLVSWPAKAMMGLITNAPVAIAPDATLVARAPFQTLPHRGFEISRVQDERMLVALGVDLEGGWDSQFSPSGAYFAWGNTDGTISACDLEAVQGRLRLLTSANSTNHHTAKP